MDDGFKVVWVSKSESESQPRSESDNESDGCDGFKEDGIPVLQVNSDCPNKIQVNETNE
jgi:hypothetical protein